MIRNIGMQNLGFGKLVKFDTDKIVNTDQIRYMEEKHEGESFNESPYTYIHFIPGGDERKCESLKIYGNLSKTSDKLNIEA